jgi:hypothetical protein
LYRGAASAYRIALLHFREQNLFNLVDLIRASPGVAPTNIRPRLYANQAAELSFALPAGHRIALNPGASESARCWPAENFARLAEVLSAAGFVPLLAGAPSDRDVCEKIEAAAKIPIPNFAGRTSISEMATLLARCDLLVSVDTGAAHVAAAVGTTVVGLYGATAWFAETAPYGDDHLILQIPLNTPMSAISVDSVLSAAQNRLGRLPVTELCRQLCRENQSAWETSIEPSQASDQLGGLHYRAIHGNSSTRSQVFARCLRQAFAAEFLTPCEILQAKQSEESDAHTICDSLAQILDLMQTVANLSAESIRKGITSDETQAVARELISATEKIRSLGENPEWKALSSVIHNLDWQLRMLPVQSPESIFRSHARAYRSAARILRRASGLQRDIARWNDTDEKLRPTMAIESESLREGSERGDRCLVR